MTIVRCFRYGNMNLGLAFILCGEKFSSAFCCSKTIMEQEGPCYMGIAGTIGVRMCDCMSLNVLGLPEGILE